MAGYIRRWYSCDASVTLQRHCMTSVMCQRVCVYDVGPVMYGLAAAGVMGSGFVISLAECFVFASLIVAVDPVAVRHFSFIRHLFLAICTHGNDAVERYGDGKVSKLN